MREHKTQLMPQKMEIIVRNYYEELYDKKFENLGEMDNFLWKYNLPKLNEEAENLNRPITGREIEAIIKTLPAQNSPGSDSFIGEFYKTFKEELTPIPVNYSKTFKEREDSQSLFMRPVLS